MKAVQVSAVHGCWKSSFRGGMHCHGLEWFIGDDSVFPREEMRFGLDREGEWNFKEVK